MQYNTTKSEHPVSKIDLSELSINPVNNHNNTKKNCICRKIILCCFFCGKNWLFERPKSLFTPPNPMTVDELWCNTDICGSICALFTWLLIMHPSFVLLFVVFIPVESNWFRGINGPIFYTLVGMAILSHLKAMFTDPGSVPKGNATEEAINQLLPSDSPIIKCVKCNSIKPSRAHHCSVCKRCVRKMDHHCPWINNCVGEDNQKYFIMFTFYIFLMSSFALYICVHFFIFCVKDEWKHFLQQSDILQKNWFQFSPLTKSLLLLSVTFESIVFGMFTLIMFFTQLCSMANDKTGIESLTKESPKWERKSCWMNISSTFNEPFSWRWFWPLSFRTCKKQNYDNNLHVV